MLIAEFPSMATLRNGINFITSNFKTSDQRMILNRKFNEKRTSLSSCESYSRPYMIHKMTMKHYQHSRRYRRPNCSKCRLTVAKMPGYRYLPVQLHLDFRDFGPLVQLSSSSADSSVGLVSSADRCGSAIT